MTSDGQPVIVILNSGGTPKMRARLEKEIADAFEKVGMNADIASVPFSGGIAKVAQECLVKAKKNASTLVAAGGDGTVNHVARLCHENDLPLGIIPLGTFNYFARDLFIPLSITEAVDTLCRGRMKKVAVGVLGEHIFLNNASFGMYTKLIRHREQATASFGRWRIVAALTAAASLLGRHKLFSVTVNTNDGTRQHYRTTMVFVGNNTLQLDNLGLKIAECTRSDKLAAIVVKETNRWETARFLVRGIMRNLKDESKLQELCMESFTVTLDRTSTHVVVDGEIVTCAVPLAFSIRKDALSVCVPDTEHVPA